MRQTYPGPADRRAVQKQKPVGFSRILLPAGPQPSAFGPQAILPQKDFGDSGRSRLADRSQRMGWDSGRSRLPDRSQDQSFTQCHTLVHPFPRPLPLSSSSEDVSLRFFSFFTGRGSGEELFLFLFSFLSFLVLLALPFSRAGTFPWYSNHPSFWGRSLSHPRFWGRS